MNLIIFAIILFSHVMAARPYYLRLREGKMPNTVDFAAISLILYYDIGLAIELLGFTNETEYFTSFFSADEEILIQAFILLVLAPWLFHLGSIIANKRTKINRQEPVMSLSRSRRTIFYLLTIVISLTLAIYGYKQVYQNASVWAGRSEITEAWGPLIIILYLPIHFLAFYVRTSDASKKSGLLFSLGLVLFGILSTFMIGQRTNVLLPILILVLFRKKITLKKVLIFVSIALIGAAALLPIFKWQYTNTNSSLGELVAQTINSDFSRSYVLTAALERTEPLGTKVMPYPLSGYIYSLLFYVPRQIVPFKGWSTAQYFTSNIVRTHVEDTNWGFGVGAIEEILLNIGLLWCIPGLLVYGMCMGTLDRLSGRVPSLVIPTRLAAIWLCGYGLSTLVLMFGTMALVGWVFHHLFVQKSMYVSQSFELSSSPSHKKLLTHTNRFL